MLQYVFLSRYLLLGQSLTVVNLAMLTNCSEFSNAYLACGSRQHIVTCTGFVTTSEHQMWRVMPLKTPFRLLIGFYYNFTRRYYN
jgi:hypothetical protein